MTVEQFPVARLPSLLRYAVVLTGDRDLAQDVQEVLAKTQLALAAPQGSERERPCEIVTRPLTGDRHAALERLLAR